MLTTTTTPSKLNGGVMRNVDEVHHQQHHHQQQQQQQQQNNLDQSNNVRRPLRNDNSPDRSDNLVALIEQLGLQPSLKTPEHELSRRPILGPRASNNILVTPIKSSVASGSQNTSPDGKFSSFVVNQVNGLETPMDISMQQQQQQQIQQPCQARRDLSSLFNIDPQIWAHPSRSSTPMGSGSAGSCANSAYGGAASSASTDRSSTATGLLSSSGSPSSLTMSQIQNILTNLSFTQTSTSSERQYQSFNSALNAISPINVPPPVIPPNVYPALQQQMLILQQQRLQAFSLAQSQRHQTTDYKSFLSGVPANGYDVGRSNLNLLDTSKPLHGITSTPCSSPVDNNFSANQPIGNQQLAVGAGRSPPCGVGGGASSIQHDCHHHHHRQNNQCSPSTGVSPISGSNGHTNVAHPVVSQTSTINAQAVVTSQQSQFYPTSGTNRLQSQQPPFEIGAGSEQRLQKGPVVTGGNVDNAAKLYRSAALVSEATCTWSGQLPPKSCKSPIYSCKVFVGGVPWDITENTLVNAFKVFGNVRVEWPGREARYARSPIRPSAKGYVYMIYENEKSMKLLLQNCTQDYSGSGDYYFKLTSRRLRTKEVRQVQIIPWIISDSNYVKCPSQRLDPKKTVFVGALHGMITAEVLATVMSDLFGGVVYAGIDTDKYKYPIGSGRVVFSNNRSYYKAVTAAFVEIKTLKFTKKVQIDPYLEDATCCLCQAQSGPYFCRELMCYRYFCKQCWQTQHSLDLMRTHKPLMRNTRRCPVLSGCPSLANGTMNNGDLATPLTTVNRCILPVMTSPSSLHPVIAPPPYSAANFMMTSSFPVTVTSATASYNANAVAPSSLQMTNFLGSFSAQQTAVSQQFSERRPALPNLNLMDYTTDINDFRNHCQLFGGAGCALSGSTSTGSETSPTFQQRYDFMRF